MNFDIEEIYDDSQEKKTAENDAKELSEDIKMSVSGFVGEGEKRHICVLFERDKDMAELHIPSYKVMANRGFTQDELKRMVDYIKENETEIKRNAQGINIMRAFLNM